MKTAQQLINAGYRRTSNSYRMVSRVDRPDWKEHMAKQHSPWSFEDGMKWVNGLGSSASDHYRRVYSKDTLMVSPTVFSKIPTSIHDPVGYIPLSTDKKRK